jgi:hypothetical protein
MRKLYAPFKFFVVVCFTLALATVANAQATRTWVSGVGDDVNPCSRTAPCKTFAGAISKTATNGEIDVLDSAGFGAVTITKSITIDGEGALGSILSAGTTGVIINVTAVTDTLKTVRLRNLSINGASTGVHGINYLAANKVYVENCVIYGVQSAATSRGIRMAVTASGSQLHVSDTTIENCASGIDLSTTTGSLVAVLDGVNLQGMTDGLILGNGANATVRDSFIVLNTGVGVKLNNSGTAAAIERTVINHNGTAILPAAGSITDLSNTSIIGNTTGIGAGGGTVQSHQNNQINLNTTPGPAPAPIGQQ